ncbi:hypothetical protein D7294_15735 [Streptomyces hoynatensis]|uniref:Uncharacterized protein n=2 Tax=Streptomyces hoynatensis TaxID=1141874 RepID=A0A3A9YZ88_9ACTN|nr:hypothetical protein D7294_15735 [Streptomyces hoynatensis]
MVGPTRFMTLLTCCELGVIDALRKNGRMTAAELGEAVGAKPDAVEQLLFLLVKEDFLRYDEEAGAYFPGPFFGGIPEPALQHVVSFLNMIKVVMLRQIFYLTESVKTGTVVGLDKLFGFQGNLYEAAAGEHTELREAWAPMMDGVTGQNDPWFWSNVDIPAGSKVLDLAGNTGFGAILTYRNNASPGLHVTTFDLPEKEAPSLENFRAHGVEEHCSFIGGDVFDGVPKGFDVVLIKNFLDMWDREDVLRILTGVNEALEPGGRVNILVPVYPEDIKDPASAGVDFFPAYFLGCTMGKGGPQKMSTYRRWLEECGFTVTKTVAQDLSTMPGALVAHGILCATKA